MSTARQVASASDRQAMPHRLWTPRTPGEKSRLQWCMLSAVDSRNEGAQRG
jgi:hypothetical protein